MRIAPSHEVVIADIHASGIADTPVDYHDLTMVTVVQLRDEIHERPPRLGELLHLDTRLFHLIVILRTDDDIGDILVYEPDLHPFTSLLHQHFLDLLAALVLSEIEIFHVDGLLGIAQILHQQLELTMPRRDDFQTVTVGHACGTVASQKFGKRLVITTYEIVLLVPEKQFEHLVIGLLSEYLDELLMLPLEKPRMAEIDADNEVKQKPHYRQYRDNQKPGDFFR